MNSFSQESNLLLWSIGLVTLFPLLVIILGEIIERLKRRKSPLVATIRIIRNLLLPISAFMLFAEYVLEIDAEGTLVKTLQTIFWVCVIHGSLSLLNAILFAQAEEDSWRSRVPKLLIDLLRLFLILLGMSIVLATVWGADLAGLLTALGVSSIVIGLALQDTLGSIISGIAMLFERPFTVGDWLRIGDLVGQVIDINWRSLRLQTLEREMVVIPHKVISSEIIRNFNRPLHLHAERVRIGFSYKDPPNLAKQVLKNTALTTEGILSYPETKVFTLSYDDFAIIYEVKFFIQDYQELEEIRDRFMTRVWYAAQRNKLTIPFPIRTLYHFDGSASELNTTNKKLKDNLQSNPIFSHLAKESEGLNNLSTTSILQHFGVGERVIEQGDKGSALYIIIAGQVAITVMDESGQEHTIAILNRGEFFGEIALFSGETSPISVNVLQDLEVIVIYADVLAEMLDNRPSLAREIGQIMEIRRREIKAVKLSFREK